MSYDTLDNAATLDGGDHEGRLLAQRYKVLRKLGEGGMGMVYLAVDTELGDHPVAIKFIPPMLAGNPRAIKNLKREALTSRQLSHPHIVRLHDLHTDGHQKFLVMEYIEGRTLDDVLGETKSERLPLEHVLDIIEQLAAGLDYAHSQQVLHRDLKPSNIMVGKDGTVKLLDFGIAREMKDSYTRVTGNLTSGTLPYMSPEQLMGENPTVAMDVYSLGAVAYECLAGHPPFYMGDIRRQIEIKAPKLIDGVSPEVNQVLLQVLDKRSDRRPISAGALAQALRSANMRSENSEAAAPPLERELASIPEPVTHEPVPAEASVPGVSSVTPLEAHTSPLAPAVSGVMKASNSAIPRAPLGSVLLAVLLCVVVWGVAYAAEMTLYDAFANDEGNLSVEQSYLLAGFWGLWCGLGTACVLLLLRLFKDWQALLKLSMAWALLLGPAYAASYTVAEGSHAWLFIALGQILGGGGLLVVLRQEGIRLSGVGSLLLVLGWLGVGLSHRWFWDQLIASEEYLAMLEKVVTEPWTVIAGTAGAVAGGLYALLILIVTKASRARGRVAQSAEATPATPPNPHKLRIAIALTVVLLAIFAGGFAAIKLGNKQTGAVDQAVCESDLSGFAAAWDLYQVERGRVPGTLEDLDSYILDTGRFSQVVYRAADLYRGALPDPALILAYDNHAKHGGALFHVLFVDGRVATCNSESQLQDLIARDNEARAQHKIHDKPIWE